MRTHFPENRREKYRGVDDEMKTQSIFNKNDGALPRSNSLCFCLKVVVVVVVVVVAVVEFLSSLMICACHIPCSFPPQSSKIAVICLFCPPDFRSLRNVCLLNDPPPPSPPFFCLPDSSRSGPTGGARTARRRCRRLRAAAGWRPRCSCRCAPAVGCTAAWPAMCSCSPGPAAATR